MGVRILLDNMSDFGQAVQDLVGDKSSFSQGVNDLLQTQNNQDDVQKAIAETGNQNYDGWCEAFVEKMNNLPNMGPSAKDAWQNWASQGKARIDTNNMKPGDLIYFDDPSNPAGHVGIFEGNNNMVSATYNGVGQNDLNDWQTQTGQQILGYVPMGGL